MNLRILLSLSIFLPNILFSQTSYFAKTGTFSAQSFQKTLLQDFAESLLAKGTEGSIKLYDSANHPLDPTKYTETFCGKQEALIINPANPDDPYDLVSATYYEFVDPQIWSSITATASGLWIRPFETKSYLLRESELAIVKNAKIIHLALLADTSHRSVNLSMQNYYNSIVQKLYVALMEQRISYSLCDTTYWEKYDARQLVAVRTVKQIINPENPNDPYDLIDTVILNLDSVPDFKKLFFYSAISETDTRLIGLGFHTMYLTHYSFCHEVLPPIWIRPDELQTVLSAEETEALKYLYLWSLIRDNTDNESH
ncbi:MAG: hypothetical protein EP332_05005 [Bacteroidetes bacterium]|nr:MAG: hypothetical protein EP332_05005 [Bacteroidota bacterium]